MGSHTRFAPSGKTISTRVVTSKLRHFSVWRGSNTPWANESFGNAAAVGRIAPVFRNARLSMSGLRSIEALSNNDNTSPGVPARDAWNTRYRLVQKGWETGEKELVKSEGRERKDGRHCRYLRRNAKFRASPQAARSRSSPRANASCVKSSVAGGSSARGPADTDEFHSGQSTPKSSPTTSRSGPLRRALQLGGRSFLIVSSTD